MGLDILDVLTDLDIQESFSPYMSDALARWPGAVGLSLCSLFSQLNWTSSQNDYLMIVLLTQLLAIPRLSV